MATQLSQLTASPMMKEYAFGLAQTAIQPCADFIAPVVNVGTAIGRYKKYNQKSRFHVPNTIRPVGERAVRITFGAEDATYNCQPNAVDVPVDILQEQESASLEDMVKEGAAMAAEVAALAHEKRVLQAALDAAGAGTTIKPYHATTPDDPIGSIDTAILSILKAVRYGSLMGIRVLVGAQAYNLIKNCAAVRSRFVTAGTPAFPNITTDTFTSLLLGKPEVMVSYMVEDTAAEGITDSSAFVMADSYDTAGASVLIFAARTSPTRRDPSFMKTFRLANQWMVPGSYMSEDQRQEIAKFDWSEDVVVTNSTAVSRLIISSATS